MKPPRRTGAVLRLADLAAPVTDATRLAEEVLREFASPALYGHSVRSYYWGAAHAAAHDLTFDAELLYVAALLHDLGLTASFDAHQVPFEVAGGAVAWVFCAGAGWPAARRRRVSDVIVKHMRESVSAHEDPEGHLLEAGTSVDISGSGLAAIPIQLQREVTKTWPRGALATEFANCFDREAARKPDSRAAAAVASGIRQRMQANPLAGS